MEKSYRYSIGLNKRIPFSLIFIFIVLIYSNTFYSQWHLDDYENITINPNIHITDLSPKSLGKTFYFKEDGKISRPFARLTFAMNWYVGKDHVIGYHIVNTSIHILTAFFLFLFVFQLFHAPRLAKLYNGHATYFIALLSSILWAIHPIQTQAVTYIVQRMASMAAMFYIMSMYFYLKGRMDDILKRKIFFIILACTCFGFGLASKENTATLPIAILLLEVIFFQDMKNPEVRRRMVVVTAIICVVVILSSSWLFLNKGLGSLLKASGYRYFTPLQRLMTEARVIVSYLSEIFYPVPSRFSIEHDIVLSTSLLKPWTTLPAILFVFLCICFGIFQMRKRPLLSFGILFFFLNHFIESTVIGIEIIFEHRNYLPSFFLFLYISAVIQWMLDQYGKKNIVISKLLTLFIAFLMMSFGISTYVRNMDWKTEQSILEDAVQKAPHQARPLTNLASVYYKKIGRPDVALKMLKKALTLKKNNKHQEAIILNNIGGIYYENGNDEEAIKYLRKSVQKFPKYSSARYKLSVALANLGKYDASKEQLNKIISNLPDNVNSPINLKGLILAKEKKYKKAFHLFRRCLGIRASDKNALLNIGALYFLKGDYQRAEMFFKIAAHHHPKETFALLWLIEVNLKLHDNNDVHKYAETLLSNVSAKSIRLLPEALSNQNMFNIGFIKPYPSKSLFREIARSIELKT